MPIQMIVDTPELGIVTTNMEAMRNFYENIVGLEYMEKLEFPGGHMHRYKLGAGVLKLVEVDGGPASTGIKGEAMSATGYRYCTVIIANIPEFVEEVKAAGFEASEITPFADGIGFVFVTDPDGNALELAGPI